MLSSLFSSTPLCRIHLSIELCFFFFNDTSSTYIYTLSLHDALPIFTSVTPASSAPVLQTPKATSSTLYFDSLTVNAGNGGFLHCIQMDTSVNAANQVVSVGADIAFDADPKFFACLV